MNATSEDLAEAAAWHTYLYATATRRLADLILQPTNTGSYADFTANAEREPMALMLALALRNISRAAIMAVKHLDGAKKTDLQGQIATVDSALPDLVHARDMLEHFDEYTAGTGRRQKTDPSLSYEITVARNGASWTLMVGPHRIDVATARAAANTLSAAVLAYTSPKLKLEEQPPS